MEQTLSLLLNILWLLLGGIPLFISYVLLGAAFCLTIIGIPFGVASINIGIAVLAPFGKQVVPKPQINTGCVTVVLTILWLFTAGLGLAIAHLISGALLCLTVIGIPLGVQNFKLMQLALLPYQYELH